MVLSTEDRQGSLRRHHLCLIVIFALIKPPLLAPFYSAHVELLSALTTKVGPSGLLKYNHAVGTSHILFPLPTSAQLLA